MIVVWTENMLANPCPFCQDRKTGSCSVWLLNPWNIVPNPRLHVWSRQGINIFPVKVFPSPSQQSFHSAPKDWDACRIHSGPNHVCLKWLLSASEGCLSTDKGISSSSRWNGPWEGKWRGIDEGREKAGRGERRIELPSWWRTMGNLVWAVALNTSILTWGRQEIGFIQQCSNVKTSWGA